MEKRTLTFILKEKNEEFRLKIKKAIIAKIKNNIELEKSLKESILPFTHYYSYDSKIVVDRQSLWLVDFWELVRSKLKENVALERIPLE